ncbi:hypothetical protein [Halobacterium zhouii]|uniref:hypothetical protein n=1 Tax=Halobacterium zhouii TaxID=2902624 RepID=UPI001E56DF8F|nr:hypothetical protein [Halobacterium zhouii]
MTGVRELLAIAIGALLGALCLAAPAAVFRLSVLGGASPTRNPGGEYGSDPEPSDRALLAVRAVGVACLAVAAFVAWQAFA